MTLFQGLATGGRHYSVTHNLLYGGSRDTCLEFKSQLIHAYDSSGNAQVLEKASLGIFPNNSGCQRNDLWIVTINI